MSCHVNERVDVLHVVPAYFPMRGGIEVLIENLVDLIRETRGLTSAIATPGTSRNKLLSYVHRGVEVHTIPQPTTETRSSPGTVFPVITSENILGDISRMYSRMRSILDTYHPRLVHIHASSSITSPAVSVAKSLDTPVIFHLHGTIDEWNRTAFRRHVRDGDWVCAVSDAVATSIRQDCSRTQPIRVIRNGVIDPSLSTVPHKPVSPSVAMIGRLSPEKGFDDGLQALNIVRDSIPDLTIRIAGDGPEQPALLQLAHELGLADAIEYFGELSHDRALRVIAGADVVLVPSRRVEGFSLVAVEAALLQRPVVATTVGGLPETVLDGQTGVLVPPRAPDKMATALTGLLRDGEERIRLGVRARERALDQFDMHRFAAEIASLYAEVLSRPPS